MFSGRIEIPLDEYKGMKARIEELERTLVSKDKEIEEMKDKCLKVQDSLEEISSLSFFERVFNWKANIKDIVENESI